MSKKATDILSYITIIGWFIAYFFGDREHCKFHLNQGLVIFICYMILSILRSYIGGFIGVILWILMIIVFVMWLGGLINAIKGTENPMLIISNIKIIK